jgi:hypothetical protein
MTYALDDVVPYYVAYVGGRWGEDVYDRPGSFTLFAGKGLRVLKRHFSLSRVTDFHLVPYWVRCLAEVLASSGVDPTQVLMRAKSDVVLQCTVRAAFALGGYVGLRDYLKAQGYIT